MFVGSPAENPVEVILVGCIKDTLNEIIVRKKYVTLLKPLRHKFT